MPDTEILPVLAHTLRRDRCVVEPSVRVLGLPLLRGRFTAAGGHFDVGDGQLTLVLDATSLRPGFRPLRRALVGPRGLRTGDITFTSEDIDLGSDLAVDLIGQVDVAGASRELRLTGELRHVDDEHIILWAKGILPAPRRRPRGIGWLARLLAGRPIHVEIAAEFVR